MERGFPSHQSADHILPRPNKASSMTPSFCDAHNHLQDERFAPGLSDVISTSREAGITRCVVNGTSESDWPQVAALARSHPDLITPSFGLPPWEAHQRSADWFTILTDLFAEFPHAGVGECGLDRWMNNHDLPDQTEVFLQQLELAAQLNSPLSIHCLQAWGPLLDCLRDHSRPERGFLLHSYGGSAPLVPNFSTLGAYFSFSGYFLHPRKESSRQAFRQVPADRLLLESDAPDMLPPEDFVTAPLLDPDGTALNHPANLPAIASGLAKILGINPEDLSTLTNNNFTRFFTPYPANP